MNTSLTRCQQDPNALTASEVDYFLVDGSGSMYEKWYDFMAAMETYLESLKAINLKSHIIAHVFDDHDLELIQRDTLLEKCEGFKAKPLTSHFGGTPLYDAINLMGRRLKDRNPEKATIVVVTDGNDTGSQTSAEMAKSILDWCKAKGWQVVFIGCDFNNSRQARQLGMSEDNSIGVQKKLLNKWGQNLAEKRKNYSRNDADISFTGDEKTQFGGYLNGPEKS